MAYAPLKNLPLSGREPVTDYSRWRLEVCDDGRHLWRYLQTDEECKAWPQSVLDKYWLGMPVVCRALLLVFRGHDIECVDIGPAYVTAGKDAT